MSVVRDLAYVQWDPVSIVAPSHIISLWSRLGKFRHSDLEGLLWKEKKAFLHWTPMASIVLTEDFPLYHSLMRRYPESLTGSWHSHELSAKKFLTRHAFLRKKILRELEQGPLQLSQFEDYLRTRRNAPDWTPTSDVSHMLFHLVMSGEVMVVGHRGNQNVWALADDFLPDWLDRTELTAKEFDRRAALRAIAALGTATPAEINYYFVRGRYRNLRRALRRLLDEDAIRKVEVEGLHRGEEAYALSEDIPLLEKLESDDFEPRLSLIAPFDNLNFGRRWTNRVFDFDYVHEQFLPAEKRNFGTYVLPILWGDRFIGRVDPRLDKEEKSLIINSVHLELGASAEKRVASMVAETIEEFGEFLGAKEVRYTSRVPLAWKSSLN